MKRTIGKGEEEKEKRRREKEDETKRGKGQDRKRKGEGHPENQESRTSVLGSRDVPSTKGVVWIFVSKKTYSL